jgi:hypothetical protein
VCLIEEQSESNVKQHVVVELRDVGPEIKDGMGGTRSARGGDKKCVQFWLESLKGRDHLEDMGIDGRLDGDRWRALVNTVMNL